MENATDALKMAAGILVFVAALSLTILAFSRAKEASEATFNVKEGTTTYYQYADNKMYSSYREIGVDGIIPMMYSYYNNFYTLLFYIGEGWDESTDTFDSIEPLPLYYTEALDQTTGSNASSGKTQLQKSTLAVKANNTNTRAIYGLDINDELTRQEPWAYNERNDKLFIDALVNGKSWTMPNWSRKFALGTGNKVNNDHQLVMMDDYHYYDSFKAEEKNPFAKNSNAKFIERVGLYNYDAVYENNDQESEGQGVLSGDSSSYSQYTESNQTQSTTTFVDENDNPVGTIANENATQKKIIQYIYIKSRK